MNDDVKRAAASGALSGTILGGAGTLLGGGGVKKALRAALMGGLGGAGLAGAGVGVGSAVMGDPEEDEINPYTRRAALGGALSGGTAGALGALGVGGAGRAAMAASRLGLPKVAQAAVGVAKNPVARFLARRHPAIAAALGGGAGALIGGYQAGDEGMQIDFLQNEMEAQERKRRAEKLAQDIMAGRYNGEDV